MFNQDNPTSCGQQGYPVAAGVKPFRRTRGPARQPSYARAKNDPVKKVLKQQETNQTVEWLMNELESRPGYTDFRNTFHQIKSNPDAIRSWTFAVDFMEAYNKLCLIVSAISTLVTVLSELACRMAHTRVSRRLTSGGPLVLEIPGFSKPRGRWILYGSMGREVPIHLSHLLTK
jgi:hypothetical protein